MFRAFPSAGGYPWGTQGALCWPRARANQATQCAANPNPNQAGKTHGARASTRSGSHISPVRLTTMSDRQNRPRQNGVEAKWRVQPPAGGWGRETAQWNCSFFLPPFFFFQSCHKRVQCKKKPVREAPCEPLIARGISTAEPEASPPAPLESTFYVLLFAWEREEL